MKHGKIEDQDVEEEEQEGYDGGIEEEQEEEYDDGVDEEQEEEYDDGVDEEQEEEYDDDVEEEQEEEFNDGVEEEQEEEFDDGVDEEQEHDGDVEEKQKYESVDSSNNLIVIKEDCINHVSKRAMKYLLEMKREKTRRVSFSKEVSTSKKQLSKLQLLDDNKRWGGGPGRMTNNMM